MRSFRARSLRCVVATLLAGAAGAPSARAMQIDHGDFIGVFVKNGVEVVVNMGPAAAGRMVDVSGMVDDPAFGGTLADAKFVGLAVEDPARTANVSGFGTQPQPNIIYTTTQIEPMPTDQQISLAMEIVDQAAAGANTWFNLLRQLPGSDSEVIQTSELFSYTNVLGLGTDAIANNFAFSTAATFDASQQLTIGVFSAVYGYEAFGGDPTEYLEVSQLGFDGGDATFAPAPEAPAVLRTLVGAVVLLASAAVRRRAAL